MFKIIRILVSSDTCLCSSVSPPGPTRRRVKSAQEPLHRQLSLGPAPSPAPATPAPGQAARFPRGGRLSGPAVMGIAVPVIKTEKEQFEMSPLRDTDIGYNLDLGERDTHKYLADTDTAAIKMEPDMDLDFCLNESLEGLMGSYPFENEADIKPDIKSHEKDFSPTTTATTTSTAPTRNIVSQQQQPTSVPTGELLLYDVVGGSAAAAWSGVILSLHQVSSQCWLVLAGWCWWWRGCDLQTPASRPRVQPQLCLAAGTGARQQLLRPPRPETSLILLISLKRKLNVKSVQFHYS